MLSKVIRFLKTDIWRIRLESCPPLKSFFIRQLRIIVLAVRDFKQDKCQFRASALTLYSLLSVVPVIAMMFGIAKGFGLEKRLEAELLQRMQNQPEIAEKIIGFANSMLANTNGGFIAGVGVILLFWTIIKALGSIESSFNDIWDIKTPRSFGRKFGDYLSVMLVCPFLLIISSSATIVISSRAQVILQRFAAVNAAVGPFIMFSLKFLPYCILWIMFTFVFAFMPNTRVRRSSALVAGIVTGTIFQFVQWTYIKFQIGVTSYGAIYGGFAALPLFLAWLQVSWVVVLFGAEISFAHQNVETYEFGPDFSNASYSLKKLLSLSVTHLLVKNFCRAEPPLDAGKISRTLQIPVCFVRQILLDLTESGVLSAVKRSNGRETAYQPAVDTDKITIKYVVESLESTAAPIYP